MPPGRAEAAPLAPNSAPAEAPKAKVAAGRGAGRLSPVQGRLGPSVLIATVHNIRISATFLPRESRCLIAAGQVRTASGRTCNVVRRRFGVPHVPILSWNDEACSRRRPSETQ